MPCWWAQNGKRRSVGGLCLGWVLGEGVIELSLLVMGLRKLKRFSEIMGSYYGLDVGYLFRILWAKFTSNGPISDLEL